MKGGRGAILVGLVLLNIAGILLFGSGFLLARFEVQERSACGVPGDRTHHVLSPALHPPTRAPCHEPPRFQRMIWIVIDALRFEFVLHPPSEHPNPFYHGHFTLVRSLLESEHTRPHCALYQFIADSPTVTMQRLKALTTGSIPTFIDINDVKFESAMIREDNVIDQWRSQNISLAFLGDDTWTQLFPPEKWNWQRDYPSFNAKDLHTVDNGVIDHLVDAVEADWQILIAHFLGVDHVGHRYGPNHIAMEAKLNQLDQVLQEVVKRMDNNTLLAIMGDHGMTEEGNHGGSTPEETDSTLFLYSKGQPLHAVDRGMHYHADAYPRVSQIDLVPTIALLTGIPIPFGNLGAVIPDLFAGEDLRTCSQLPLDESKSERLMELVRVFQLNAAQILTYLHHYSDISSQFPTRLIQDYEKRFERLAHQATSLLPSESSLTPEERARAWCSLAQEYHETLHQVADMCREQWAHFDLLSMAAGIGCLLVSALLVTALIIRSLPRFEFSRMGGQLTSPGGVWMSVWMVFCLVLHGYGQFSNSYIEMDEKVVSFLVAASFLWYLFPAFFRDYYRQWNVQHLLVVGVLCIVRLSSQTINTRQDAVGSHDTIAQSTWEAFYLLSPLVVGLAVLHSIGQYQYSQRYLRRMQALQELLTGAYWVIKSYHWYEHNRWVMEGLPRLVYLLGGLQMILLIWNIRSSTLLRFHPLAAVPMQHTNPIMAGLILNVLVTLWSTLSVIVGAEGTWVLLGLILQVLLLVSLSKNVHQHNYMSVGTGILLSLTSLQFFFAAGRHWQLSTLQFECAFIGFEEFNWLAGFVIMMAHTFAAPLLVLVSLPLFVGEGGSYLHAFLRYRVFFSWHIAMTVVFVYVERRHLMVWRVFAPKLLLESVFVVFIDLCISALFLILSLTSSHWKQS